MKNSLPVVTKQQAIKLKKIGFDLEIDYAYRDGSGMIVPIVGSVLNWNAYDKSQSAPTVALALKWIRDVKNILVVPRPKYLKYDASVLQYPEMIVIQPVIGEDGKTYEEAESAGLDKVLYLLCKI